jgi:hypothetical protein
MATALYRCPDTGLNVQGWFADDGATSEGEVYEAMTCPACTRVHLVNPATGRVCGAGD